MCSALHVLAASLITSALTYHFEKLITDNDLAQVDAIAGTKINFYMNL